MSCIEFMTKMTNSAVIIFNKTEHVKPSKMRAKIDEPQLPCDCCKILRSYKDAK